MEVLSGQKKRWISFLASLQKKGKVSSLIRVAVSKDEAFCFIYEANMQLLREMGVKLIPFSPIHDTEIPAADGVLFYGGYPELFAKELSENEKMRQDDKEKLAGGLAMHGRCGGFRYLHQTMEDMEGNSWPMTGIIDGTAYRTKKLGRFGYIELERAEDEKEGCRLKGHEFHYFDSTSCGESYLAKKAS